MEPFKNFLNFEVGQKIATSLEQHHSTFSKKLFLKDLKNELEPLSLKERMAHLTHKMTLSCEKSPQSFSAFIKCLKSEKNPTGLSGFEVWPLTHFVSLYGLEDYEVSLDTLKEMTKVFTSEFAVRPFFLKWEKQTLKKLSQWTTDSNEAVRRLVSEGSRPLLPWGQKLPRFLDNPELTWPLLKALQNDPSLYVQKSVSNHLNDLSKKNPDWIINQTQNWTNLWIKKQALRTLIKKGHPQALLSIGGSTTEPLIKKLKLTTKQIQLGEKLIGSLELHNHTKKILPVIIDIEIGFKKSKGQLSPKVFKGKSLQLNPGETKTLCLVTPIKKVTTRTYYFGKQSWTLLVNGHKQKTFKFILE